jgi:hypothetical protein
MTDQQEEWYKRWCQRAANHVGSLGEHAANQFAEIASASLARPLAVAARRAVEHLTHLPVEQLVSDMQALDEDLHSLARLASALQAVRAQYGRWTQYWTSETRDAALVRGLLAEVAATRMADLQRHIGNAPPVGLSVRGRALRHGYKRHADVRPCHVGRQARALGALFGRTEITADLTLGFMLQCPTKRKTGVLDVCVAALREHAVSDPAVQAVVESASGALPDAELPDLAGTYADLAAEAYSRALYDHMVRSQAHGSVPAHCVLGIPLDIRLLLTSTSVLATVGWLAATYAPTTLWVDPLMLSAGIGSCSVGCAYSAPRLRLRRLVLRRAIETLQSEAGAAASTTAMYVNASFFFELTRRATVALAARPLARILGGSYD